MVRHVANKTNDVAGDRTTPATILGRAIFNKDEKAVAAGLNPIDVKHGIDKAVNHALSHLKFTGQDVTSKDAVIKVARISSKGDKILSGHGLKGDAFEKGRNDGVVSIQDGSSFEDTLKIIEGMKFDGFTSPSCITTTRKQAVEYNNPLLLLFVEKKISSGSCLLHIIEQCHIVVQDADDEALSTLLLNRLRLNLLVFAIKAHGFGDKLEDITMGDLGR